MYSNFDVDEFNKKDFRMRKFNNFVKELIFQAEKGTFNEFCKVYDININEAKAVLELANKFGHKDYQVIKQIEQHRSIYQAFQGFTW